MTKLVVRNVAASVRQRLLNLSRERGEGFDLIVTRYAIERVLYRLSQSAHRERFVLKGATLFTVWSGAPHRATHDLDLLGFGSNSPARLEQLFRGLCTLDVVDDGLTFDAETVKAAPIRDDNIYGGIRVTFVARLGTARIALQVDVGFGDEIIPDPQELSVPTILDFPAPVLRAYAKETVVAEKFHAMTVLGMTNSRMKDFFDIAWLAEHFAFDGIQLGDAIRATFVRRATELPRELPLGLSREFSSEPAKQAQWRAFVRRINQPSESTLEEVVGRVAAFVGPVVIDEKRERTWPPGGPWSAP